MKCRNRGLASLTMALMLLLATTIVALSAQRSMVFELRSGANQVRATQAFELAESGLAWGIEKLNDPRALELPGCDGAASLRDREPPWTLACNASGCRCGTPAGQEVEAGFVLSATRADGHRLALEARGCTRLGACADGAEATLQAVARHRQLVEALPLTRLHATAAVVAAAQAHVGGTVRIVNRDRPSHGTTLMSGAGITAAATAHVEGWPGTPPQATWSSNEPLLARWASDGAELFFAAFFGGAPQDYRLDPLTRVIGGSECGAPQPCGQVVAREAAAGYRHFWVDGDVELGDASLGTAERPVVLAVAGNLSLAGTTRLHGLVVGMGASLRLQGDGAVIHGSVLAHGPVELEGSNLELTYAPVAPTGRYVEVPGSWRDFAAEP